MHKKEVIVELNCVDAEDILIWSPPKDLFPPIPIKNELIRCKDCKYFSTDFNGNNSCDLYMDALSPWAESRYSPSENDYCSKAVRKEE